MLTAVVGINWGDEGKGRMVDLLSADFDIICRYQGGNNAGHTVINDAGKFVLNLLPVGILRSGVANVMGPGMVINIEHLCGEIAKITKKGIPITSQNLKISDRAFICLPYHVNQDIWEEDRLADKKYGSTRRGIAPVYGDKYMKKGIRMGDLLSPATLRQKVEEILDWKNLQLAGYRNNENAPSQLIDKKSTDKKGFADLDETMAWLEKFAPKLTSLITDTTAFLESQLDKKILFEAQLGALRDIDYGIYPYTTSSQVLASYATAGAGIPGQRLNHVIGAMKAFSSCVGEGPFAAEFFGEEADKLRNAGPEKEFGAATGRPRRVGAFDVVASRYGIQMQGADEIALTKLDVLSYFEKIPVCVAYEIDGVRTTRFPSGDALMNAKPVFEYLDGFKTEISHCRKKEDLPAAALKYIEFIETAVACPIKYVSVGPGREDYILMK